MWRWNEIDAISHYGVDDFPVIIQDSGWITLVQNTAGRKRRLLVIRCWLTVYRPGVEVSRGWCAASVGRVELSSYQLNERWSPVTVISDRVPARSCIGETFP